MNIWSLITVFAFTSIASSRVIGAKGCPKTLVLQTKDCALAKTFECEQNSTTAILRTEYEPLCELPVCGCPVGQFRVQGASVCLTQAQAEQKCKESFGGPVAHTPLPQPPKCSNGLSLFTECAKAKTFECIVNSTTGILSSSYEPDCQLPICGCPEGHFQLKGTNDCVTEEKAEATCKTIFEEQTTAPTVTVPTKKTDRPVVNYPTEHFPQNRTDCNRLTEVFIPYRIQYDFLTCDKVVVENGKPVRVAQKLTLEHRMVCVCKENLIRFDREHGCIEREKAEAACFAFEEAKLSKQ